MNNSTAKKFTDLLKTERESNNIFLVTGGKDKLGRAAWYYIAVESLKTTFFKKAISSGSVKLDDFGKVILSGFGEVPNDEAKKIMKEKYNFEE